MSTQTSLTRVQLVQLVAEYQDLRDWTIVRDFCDQVYGVGKVVQLEVETYGEYNDEGGTDYRIEHITASSSSGQSVAFDLSLPFWQEGLKDHDTLTSESDPDDFLEELRDWWPTTEEKASWLQWSDLPCDVHEGGNKTYNLTQIPPVTFPVLIN